MGSGRSRTDMNEPSESEERKKSIGKRKEPGEEKRGGKGEREHARESIDKPCGDAKGSRSDGWR